MRPVLGLADAVRAHVRPGTRVYLGNFGAQLFCVGHEVIRQGVRDVDLVIASGGLLMDQLLGAGVLRSATFGHCWSPVGPAPAHNFRRAAEGGAPVALHEMSLGLLTAALTAGAWGVPFLPVPDRAGTGYVDEDWTRGLLDTATCRFGTSRVVRAEVPDVAFVHADLADADGNGVVRGPLGEVVVAAQAARAVVLVAEELAPAETVRAAGITIPGLLVSAVVHHPGALAPDGALGRYDRDVAAYERYARRAATPEGFRSWLEEEVLT
ncbi:MAG TPA: CoA-transferase [Pseudonocardia sp.]|uniref:CoA-transferase n=1 Tax=Pseudonocardia sp. TaxID=60912 RepID=UPI002B4B43C8|nr:CoA-transferase [Pseudonocardia sp.]HLU60380.1 CoA-transferase [Pseudonocardia sp.]